MGALSMYKYNPIFVSKPRPSQEPLLIEFARLPHCSTPTGRGCGTTKGANTMCGAFTMHPKVALTALHQVGGQCTPASPTRACEAVHLGSGTGHTNLVNNCIAPSERVCHATNICTASNAAHRSQPKRCQGSCGCRLQTRGPSDNHGRWLFEGEGISIPGGVVFGCTRDLGVLEVPQRPSRLGMQVAEGLSNTVDVHPSRTLGQKWAKWAHPYVIPHVNNEERKECLTNGYTDREKLLMTHMQTCT